MVESAYHVYAKDSSGVEKCIASYNVDSPREAKKRAKSALKREIYGVIDPMTNHGPLTITRVVKEKIQKRTK